MNAVPLRLKAKRIPLLRRPDAPVDETGWAGIALPTNRRIVRKLRAARRIGLIAVWTVFASIIQGALLLLPGMGKVLFARFYWATICGLLGMRVRVIGGSPRRDGRPVIYVSNHSSWLDIPVLGGRLPGCFVSKDEVSRWPVVNIIGKLGRTVYVRRKRASIGRERDDMAGRLAAGDNLILFPEGTSSDGSRVLPFRSAFLSVAEHAVTADGKPPLVQPVSVVYDRLAYLPTGRASRAMFAWHGDMRLGPHAWRLAQHRGLRATILLHTPLEPGDFADRKALARAAWTAVADGAATLRQNRPARPLGAEGFAETASDTPSFA